jgi:hypothetical protein
MKMLKVICALFVFGFVSVSHAAVIFITEEATVGVHSLLGADNVEVNGLYFNVRFLDGSCIALFNGCDDPEDFLFGSNADALAASNSLLSQVFIRGTSFDIFPQLTNGCGSQIGCDVITPFALFGTDRVSVWTVLNQNDDNVDFVRFFEGASRAGDTGARILYAVWSKPVEASAPGTAMVLLMGIAGLIVSQRRKQA